jgi:phosphohistidine phosphatase
LALQKYQYMKKLMLIRHAKAEKEPFSSDFDRPLKYIGIQDATFMADRIKDLSLVPQHIVTSPALRTKTTAEIFADHLALGTPEENETIYAASLKAWLKAINGLSDKYDFTAVVGHNPGVADILYYLTGQPHEVHTSTVALIEFEFNDWASISENTGSLVYYSSPKE